MRCFSIIRCFSLLALFCTGILFLGCHEEIAIDHKDNDVFYHNEQRTRASDELLYHEDTGFLLEAYDDPLFAKEGDEITHLAIEFYPKTIDEYFFLRNLPDDVLVDYIPFGFLPVREISLEESRDYQCYPRPKQYTERRVSLLNSENTDNREISHNDCFQGPLPEPCVLPILYAVWPIEKPIPTGIEYKIDHSVSMPVMRGEDKDNLRVPGQVVLPITVNTYEALLDDYVPLEGIKIRISCGLSYADFYTDSTGTVRMKPLLTAGLMGVSLDDLENATVRIVFDSPKWIIGFGSSVSPYTRLIGTVSSLWGTMVSGTTYPTYVSHCSSNVNEYEIYRAVKYYYDGIHDFSNYVSYSEWGIIIHASVQSGAYAGVTSFPNGTPDITIYDVFNGFQCFCIGTVLHELGHVHHHYQVNGSISPTSLIKESYASYIGWCLGEQYYLDKGYIKPFSNYHINDQHRQGWTPSSGSNYTPLFVDLSDNYNQSAIIDIVSGVPASVINSMGGIVSSVSEVYSYLLSYVGVYFTQTGLDINLSYY